ncbi:cytochrome P450 4F4-like [Mizuhopecten yessoensis]|uniref:Cytochrome P450 4F4 n=1 Tax=Mizuhopecten yessoensis TaxID=6573 RepID=A0A210Q1T2_MIZYE|nr:cytochrome P450 4F4-like [Mizuhopecten yessoensis]XP_021369477.1 cytochrome P450 4F4-like [Mizuhopecten yessoensis]XP_021369478.1 cytochrome P450 4F4-like [Mizuhopecten yessoensis]XP_021369479.1 cytochrome P450 4F4-like [Mizuhopecten yessoensis]XP_021369480.1 cytochrome P450 4F4-like [Mizuhopecten yessoensis]OWF42682.1 Cytochrome P450 4F4 [Mizuhopecten yessoensis]
MDSWWIVQLVLATVLAVVVWKLVKFNVRYRGWCRVARQFQNIGPLHPVWGNLHLFKHTYDWMVIAKKVVNKDKPRIIVTWMTNLFPNFSMVHPDTAKVVLKASVPKPTGVGSPYGAFVSWLGYGLLTSSGSKWQRNRRMLTPAFHFDILRTYVDVYNKSCDRFINKLESISTEGKSVEITKPTAVATLDILLRCALSYESDIQEQGDKHPYVLAVDELTHMAADRFINPLLQIDAVFRLTSAGKRYFNLCDYVHDFANKIIQTRKETLENNPSSTQKRRLDFLDMLITTRDTDGQGLSDLEIRDEVDTFMFAGHDTTASVLSWTFYCLGKYPEYQQKVFEEVREIMQDRVQVTWDDLPRMQIIHLFLKETMRMYTPVPTISRTLKEPLEVDGVILPASIDVMVQIDCINHHPDNWPDHEKFRLDRFEDHASSDKDPFSYVPFSAGPRNCIGQNFALNEMKVILAKVLNRFRIVLDEDHEVVALAEVVMKAKDGIKVKLLPR